MSRLKSKPLTLDFSSNELGERAIPTKFGYSPRRGARPRFSRPKRDKEMTVLLWWLVSSIIISMFIATYVVISVNEPNVPLWHHYDDD